MPKATTPTSAHSRRHNPLENDILATGPLRQKTPKRKSRANENDDHYVDSKASRNILSLGRELAEEEAALPSAITPEATADPYSFNSRFPDAEQDYVNPIGDDEEAWGDQEEGIDEIEIEPQDLSTFHKFLPEDEDDLLKYGWGGKRPEQEEPQGQTTNLADLILAKIQEHEMKMEGNVPDFGNPDEEYELPEKVVEAFTRVGQFLSRYKSGKLPKLFKILPTTPNWEQIIDVTKPSEWTPNAVYEATKIFASGNREVAAAFLELVLLDRVRDDIYEHKKLNVHLFNAMKKGLYHPGSFFKGFLFPLVGSGTCTLREAAIVCGVLSRHKIPVLYSAVALQKLCEFAAEEASQGTELSGATNLFIKTLLEKKYALPYQVIDSLVFHFLRFRSMDPASIKTSADMEEIDSKGNIRAKLPVIWHKSLLSFAERYRNDITEDQREALLDLLQTHGHYAIAPEVRRQLIAGRPRGVAVEPQGVALDGDDTMLVDN